MADEGDPVTFDYFAAPLEEMSHLAAGERRCVFCETNARCFDLGDGKHGCFECLRRGRFYFTHATEVGFLSPDHGLESETRSQKRLARQFKRVNLAPLLRTPQFVTWQGERWLVHCDDFMVYLGEWQPTEFVKHAAPGDARRLFVDVLDREDAAGLWDDGKPEGAAAPESWYFHVHVFRCRHCDTLRAHWDCA